MNRPGRIFPVFALALMAASVLCCVRPSSFESFVPVHKASDGVYVFDFEMSDTLSTYDFEFFTRIDGERPDSLPLRVMWLAPSGKSFSETVYMNPGLDVEKYRSGVAPAEQGRWRICVRPAVESPGFRGLGLVCKTNGTR